MLQGYSSNMLIFFFSCVKLVFDKVSEIVYNFAISLP